MTEIFSFLNFEKKKKKKKNRSFKIENFGNLKKEKRGKVSKNVKPLPKFKHFCNLGVGQAHSRGRRQKNSGHFLPFAHPFILSKLMT